MVTPSTHLLILIICEFYIACDIKENGIVAKCDKIVLMCDLYKEGCSMILYIDCY